MGYILTAKQLCLEHDFFRCRHCGASQNLFVTQITKRKGPLAWSLSNLITLCGGCLDAAKKSLEIKNNRVGILLAGGKGSRLAPLTKFQGKHSLPIGLIPMVTYPLKTLRAFDINRALVVLDRESAGEITQILGSGKEFGMDISYKIQEGSGGLSEALYLAKNYVRPEEEIFCILGDNIFDHETMDTNVSLGNNKACVFTKKVANPQDYGVLVFDDVGNIKEVVEKPEKYISSQAVLGLYVYKYDIFDVIEKIKPSARGELEISSANDYYAKEGTLMHKEITGYWYDAGSSIQNYCAASLWGAKKANVSAEEVNEFISVVFDNK